MKWAAIKKSLILIFNNTSEMRAEKLRASPGDLGKRLRYAFNAYCGRFFARDETSGLIHNMFIDFCRSWCYNVPVNHILNSILK